MKTNRWLFILAALLLCPPPHAQAAPPRIVSLDGTATEILFALGVGDQIVGRDMTSYYPQAAQKIPLVGQHHHFSAEGILSKKPDLVFVPADSRNPEIFEQISGAGAKVVKIPAAPSIQAAVEKIDLLANLVNRRERGRRLVRELRADLQALEGKFQSGDRQAQPRALFLYMRGSQSVFLCGEGSKAGAMLDLVRAKNAVIGITGCKPMNPEAVAGAKPDALVVFEQGLESVGGVDGLLAIPGVAQTPAGKNRRIVAVDDLYFSSFGPRTGQAALDLFQGLYEAKGVYVAKQR